MNIKNDQFAQLCLGMFFYKPWFQRVNRKVVILDGSGGDFTSKPLSTRLETRNILCVELFEGKIF